VNDAELHRQLVNNCSWWRKPRGWELDDPDLRGIADSRLAYEPAVLEDIAPDGLYVLRGPRRVGTIERPNLTIKVSRFTGSKAALAKIRRFELGVIDLEVGATNVNKPVKVGGAPGGFHIKGHGTGELLVVSGHLYTVLIRFNEQEPFGSEASLSAQMLTIGNSVLTQL
jgi:hypothetical protein